jgi:hypothetical protein
MLNLPLEKSLEFMGFTNLMTTSGLYTGTSCSTPFVAGLIALMASDYLSRGIKLSTPEARRLMQAMSVKMILKPNHVISHNQTTNTKVVIGYHSELETDIRRIGHGYPNLNGYVSPVIPTFPDNTIKLTIGSNIMTVKGIDIEIPVAPQIIEGTTMLPLRVIAHALGLKVEWNNTTKTVTLRGDS